jgi:outer membrane biosynthesis protein TonB
MIRTRLLPALLVSASLVACSGGNGVAPGVPGQSPADTPQNASLAPQSAAQLPNPDHLSPDDAVKVAQGTASLKSALAVSPPSLKFTSKEPQEVTVTVKFPSLLFAGVADDRVARVEPKIALVFGGSTKFKVTPLADGKTALGIVDAFHSGARVPITVALGASPSPTPTASPKPTATPTVKPTATPTVKPTATPTVKPTATPTVKPTATPTVKPTATPTAKPTATPTVKPTATPTAKPTATPTAAACPAPPLDPNSATITLTGSQQTVTVPCFKDFTGSAVVPANGNAGDSITIQSSTDKNFGAVANSSYGTPIVYTSLQPASSVTFNNSSATISTTVSSPSEIGAGHTYAVQAYVPSFGAAIQTITGIKPTGHSLNFNIAPPGGSFPAIQAVIILYQSS